MESDDYYSRSSNGLRLYSRIFPGPEPNAPVVVCLHGLLRTGRDFEDLAPHLARRFRVVVPDVRGRGLSERDPDSSNYQIPVYISDLLRLLRGLGAGRVSIVGTSMGGLIAMVLAGLHPDVVSRIVLNDVGPEVDPTGLARIRGYAGRALATTTWEGATEQLRQNFGPAWPGLPDSRWIELARRSYRADAAGSVRADADPAIGDVIRNSPNAVTELWGLWQQLQRIPILAVRGELSDVLSVATLARMQAEKPDLRTLLVRDRGHVPLLDEPGVVETLDDFLTH